MDDCYKIMRLARIILFILVVCLCGCKTVQTQSTTTIAHERTEQAKEIERDSVFIDRWHTLTIKGDTVWRVDSIQVARERLVFRTDTVLKTDTARVEVVQVATVNKLNGWQKFIQACGYIFLVAIVLLVILGIIKVCK